MLWRYERQAVTIHALAEGNSLAKGLSINKARDLLWVFTGRDIYRMLVMEQNWTPDEYEKWLAELLVNTLTVGKNQ